MAVYWVLFLTGLVGGVSHCIGMCGGFVAAYSLAGGTASPVRFQSLYHTGRVVTYAAIGAVLGFIGAWPGVQGRLVPAQWLVPILAGILMIAMGLWLAGLLPWKTVPLSGAESKESGVFARSVLGPAAALARSRNPFAALPLGALMGLVPCGFLATAEIAAAASGGALMGAGAMLAFGLGTVPALFAFGLVSSLVGTRLRATLLKVSGILVAGLGVYYVAHGIQILSLPSCCR